MIFSFLIEQSFFFVGLPFFCGVLFHFARKRLRNRLLDCRPLHGRVAVLCSGGLIQIVQAEQN